MVALALIPEAISFSIIAGVDPRVGLFASFTMAVTIAIVGGRPAMISAATGSVALVIAPVARSYGLVVTVGVTVATNNLAYGVILGVVVATLFFARRVAHFTEVVDVQHPDDHTRSTASTGRRPRSSA